MITFFRDADLMNNSDVYRSHDNALRENFHSDVTLSFLMLKK